MAESDSDDNVVGEVGHDFDETTHPNLTHKSGALITAIAGTAPYKLPAS